jgi:hypothetical protein
MSMESRSTGVLKPQSHQLSNFLLIGRPSGIWSPGEQYTPSFPGLQGQRRQDLLDQSQVGTCPYVDQLFDICIHSTGVTSPDGEGSAVGNECDFPVWAAQRNSGANDAVVQHGSYNLWQLRCRFLFQSARFNLRLMEADDLKHRIEYLVRAMRQLWARCSRPEATNKLTG